VTAWPRAERSSCLRLATPDGKITVFPGKQKRNGLGWDLRLDYLCVYKMLKFMGWETGIEPATFGATDRRSTS
jgi:hypothetical protein